MAFFKLSPLLYSLAVFMGMHPTVVNGVLKNGN